MNKFFSSSPIWPTTGLTLVRLFVGAFMIYHGWEVFSKEDMNKYMEWDMFKGSSTARIMVYAGKASELIGGIMLFIGFLTRLAALILIGTMIYITFFVGNGKIWMDAQHPFLFVLLAIVFLVMGGGRWSADHLLSKK